MKIGMNLLLWTDNPTVKEHGYLLPKLKAWGFDGVELSVGPMDSAEAQAFSKALDDAGLDRSSTHALDATMADPISEDPKLRQAAVDEIKTALDRSKELGADVLAGPLFQGLGRFSGAAPTADEWAWGVETMREVGRHAKDVGVRLALEPLNRFEMYIVNTMADAARFVRDVGVDSVGLLADTHHSNIEEKDTVEAWRDVADTIYHVHISENYRGVPGQGQAIKPGLFQMLKQVGYQGWLTIEAFGLQVPGLISRLHLWRPFVDDEDDIPRLGAKFIRERLENE